MEQPACLVSCSVKLKTDSVRFYRNSKDFHLGTPDFPPSSSSCRLGRYLRLGRHTPRLRACPPLPLPFVCQSYLARERISEQRYNISFLCVSRLSGLARRQCSICPGVQVTVCGGWEQLSTGQSWLALCQLTSHCLSPQVICNFLSPNLTLLLVYIQATEIKLCLISSTGLTPQTYRCLCCFATEAFPPLFLPSETVFLYFSVSFSLFPIRNLI